MACYIVRLFLDLVEPPVAHQIVDLVIFDFVGCRCAHQAVDFLSL